MPQPPERPRQAALGRRLDHIRWRHCSGPYQALDLRFGVRTCDPALGEYLATTFAAFATPTATDDPAAEGVVWLSALDRGDGRARRLVGYLGGRRLVATAAPALLLAHLLWALNREVLATARGAILVHAAAAERDGAVVVLPGVQRAGKTTLVAGLLRRGYRYVTDEAVAVDIASGRLRPYPKALGLEPGSQPLFPDLAPEPAADQRRYVGAQWHVPATRLAGVATGAGARPRVLLGPRYQTGARTELTRVRPAEGLILLAQNSFNGSRWGQAGLSAAVAVVRGCPVVGRLTVGGLDEACDIVDRAVDDALGAVPQDGDG